MSWFFWGFWGFERGVERIFELFCWDVCYYFCVFLVVEGFSGVLTFRVFIEDIFG